MSIVVYAMLIMLNGSLNRIEQANLVCKIIESMTPVKDYYGIKIW